MFETCVAFVNAKVDTKKDPKLWCRGVGVEFLLPQQDFSFKVFCMIPLIDKQKVFNKF